MVQRHGKARRVFPLCLEQSMGVSSLRSTACSSLTFDAVTRLWTTIRDYMAFWNFPPGSVTLKEYGGASSAISKLWEEPGMRKRAGVEAILKEYPHCSYGISPPSLRLGFDSAFPLIYSGSSSSGIRLSPFVAAAHYIILIKLFCC